MRLSAAPGSRFYDVGHSKVARVLIDGKEVTDVMEASEEEGWAELLDMRTLQPKRVYGAVQIILPEER